MLKKFWLLLSLFLILIIFLRMPQETVGLSSFASKSDILGSPSSAQRSLNIITAAGVFIYIMLAFLFNIQ